MVIVDKMRKYRMQCIHGQLRESSNKTKRHYLSVLPVPIFPVVPVVQLAPVVLTVLGILINLVNLTSHSNYSRSSWFWDPREGFSLTGKFDHTSDWLEMHMYYVVDTDKFLSAARNAIVFLMLPTFCPSYILVWFREIGKVSPIRNRLFVRVGTVQKHKHRNPYLLSESVDNLTTWHHLKPSFLAHIVLV